MAHTTYVDIRVRAPSMDGVYRRSRKKWRKGRAYFLYTLLILLVTTAIFAFVSRTRAEAILTPHTCLGGWSNPSNAAGAPDITDGDASKYSDANSASVLNTLAEIYCGDFSGDIPKDTKPTAITINFSWALVPKQAPVEISASPADLASSTNAILDAAPESVGVDSSTNPAAATDTVEESAPTDVPSEPSVPPPQDSQSSETSPTDVPADPPPPAETPESAPPLDAPAPDAPPPAEPTPDSPQSSIVQKILSWLAPKKAHAQEITDSTTSTSVATTTDSFASASTTASTIEDAVLEVSYTLDGSTWHVLGTVTRSNLSLSSFVIPVDAAPEWSDLEHLQIRVKSLSTVSDIGTIYLDGMSLVVDYEKDSQEVQDQNTAEQSAAFLRTLPDADLTTSNILNSNTLFTAQQVTQSDGKAGIRFSAAHSGNLIVYKGMEHAFFMSSGMGDQPLEMPLYFFPPDMYTVVDVGNADECAPADIIGCRSAPSYQGESSFSVSLASSTSVSSGSDTLQEPSP